MSLFSSITSVEQKLRSLLWAHCSARTMETSDISVPSQRIQGLPRWLSGKEST